MNERVALVTGCSSGFGRLLVARLLADGWRVIATLRGAAARGQELVAEAGPYASRLIVRDLDVADAASRAAIAAYVEKEHGGLDLLVNNAGYDVWGAFEDLSEEELRRQFEVNFFGAAFTTRALLPSLRRARGKVVMVSSVLGYVGIPMGGAYCSSKFAMEGLSEAMAYELLPHGVQVCVVEPGAFRTKFQANVAWAAGSARPDSPYAAQTAEMRAVQEKRRGQGADPDSVVDLIARLARKATMPRRVRAGKDAAAMAWLMRLLPDQAAYGVLRLAFSLMSRSAR